MKTASIRCMILLWLSIAVLFLLSILQRDFNTYDSGNIITAAQRILAGELPHKDYWTMYPFGQASIAAIVLKIFTSLTALKFYDAGIKLCICYLLYVLSKNIYNHKTTALGVSALAIIWIGSQGFILYPTYPALLYCLVALLFLFSFTESRNYKQVIYASVFMVVAATHKHDIAAYFSTPIFIYLLATNRRAFIAFILPMLILATVLSLLFSSLNISITQVFYDLIAHPYLYFSDYRSLPYPKLEGLSDVKFYLFPLIAASALIKSTIARNNKMTLLSSISIFLLLAVKTRSGVSHLMPHLLTALAVTPYLLQGKFKGVLVIILTVITIKPIANLTKPIRADLIKHDTHKVSKYISQNSASSDLIYVGLENHDKTMINHSIIYSLSNRRPASRYHELHPAVSDLKEAQINIIEELGRKKPKFIILTNDFWHEDNKTQNTNELDLLDDFISNQYKIQKVIGHYKVLIDK